MLDRNFNHIGLIDSCALNLGALFSDEASHAAFLRRLSDYIASDQSLARIVRIEGDTMLYESESYVPAHIEGQKPNLFVIVGNPAPESVVLRAMYAYEGERGRQHRFWKVLHRTRVLRFSEADPDFYSPHDKMIRLYAGEYTSPFNLHIVPFFSLPSPPGGPWAGVAGLRRLLGPGFPQLMSAERSSVRELIGLRERQYDTVLVMQRDAYVALKPASAPNYDGPSLRRAAIEAIYSIRGSRVLCMPPTRLLYSQVTKTTLLQLVEEAENLAYRLLT